MNPVELLGYINDLIKTNSNADLSDFLDLIGFKDLDYQQAIKLIIKLLDVCLRHNNSDAGEIVYAKHQDFYDLDSDIQFHTILFLNREVSVDLMKFIIFRIIKGTTFMGTTRELIQILADYNSSELRVAFNKVINVYPVSTVNVYKDLYEYAKGISEEISGELLRLIRKNNAYAEIPKWMTNRDVLPKESLVQPPPPKNLDDSLRLISPEELINKMMNLIREEISERLDCTDIDLVKDTLMSQYNALSLPQKYEFAKDYIERENAEARFQDVTLFITLGPSAPLLGSSLEELDYGSSRMFSDTQFEQNESDDDFDLDAPTKDWFRGYCQQCNLRIRRRWHAVRVPLRYGGWEGCMCSWKCTKDSIVIHDKANPVMLTLCDIYEREMITYGIIDRIPDEEYPDYLETIVETHDIKDELENKGTIDLNTIIDTPEGQDIEKSIKADIITIDENAPVLLLYFYADDCDICTKFTPQLEQLVEFTTYGGGLKKLVNLKTINTNEQNVEEYNVSSVPTVIVYHNEIPVQIFVGDQIRPIVDLLRGFQ